MFRSDTVGRRFLLGAALGVSIGVCLIGIGVLTALIILVTGGHLEPLTTEDWRVMGSYVAGFSLIGGILTAVRIHERGRGILYLGYMVGGVIVMLAIAIGDQGWKGLALVDWIVLSAIGLLFGAAAAHGHLRFNS